jgi:beta-RFAP synthase
MIQAPGVELTVSRATAWSAEGPLAERALAFARRFAESTPELTWPCHIAISRGAPEHAGLGTGTQLGMAVAHALARAAGLNHLDAPTLAARIGRGERSGLGIYGFAQGGFLVEAGQRAPGKIAPLAARLTFPVNWRILLVLPPCGSGLHGTAERLAFARLNTSSTSWTDALCRLVLLGMLPALIEADYETFGEALHDFNARVGEAFALVQGGTYADLRIAEIVRFVRDQGVRGVGQSSWGPAVFVVVADEERGDQLAQRLRSQFELQGNEVILTRARNRGADVSGEW